MAGLSQNFTLLLAGRTVQGIGGGGIIVLTQVIICDLVPLRLRGQWFGVISGMYAIGSVSGPLLGGVFSEQVSWVSSPLGGILRSFRLTRRIALDLLDQSSFHRSRAHHDPTLYQTWGREDFLCPQTSPDRLDWLDHLHRFNDRLSHTAFLGWRILSLVFMAYCSALQR